MAESSCWMPLRTLEGLSRCMSLILRTSDLSKIASRVSMFMLRRLAEMILTLRFGEEGSPSVWFSEVND